MESRLCPRARLDSDGRAVSRTAPPLLAQVHLHWLGVPLAQVQVPSAPTLQRGTRGPCRCVSGVCQVLSQHLCSIKATSLPATKLSIGEWPLAVVSLRWPTLPCRESQGVCWNDRHRGRCLSLEKLGAGTDLQEGQAGQLGKVGGEGVESSVRAGVRTTPPQAISYEGLAATDGLPQVVNLMSCPSSTPVPLAFLQKPTILPSCIRGQPYSPGVLQAGSPPAPGRDAELPWGGGKHELHLWRTTVFSLETPVHYDSWTSI